LFPCRRANGREDLIEPRLRREHHFFNSACQLVTIVMGWPCAGTAGRSTRKCCPSRSGFHKGFVKDCCPTLSAKRAFGVPGFSSPPLLSISTDINTLSGVL